MKIFFKIFAIFTLMQFSFCKAKPATRTANLSSTNISTSLTNAVEVSTAENIVASITPTTCISSNPNDQNQIAQLTPKTTDQIFYTPDGPPRAYRDQSGKIRLIVPHHISYAFTGSSLENLNLDCRKVISFSNYNANPASFDDASWPWSPYRLSDGRFFMLYHHETHAKSHPGEIACADDQCWFPALTWGSSPDGVNFNLAPISKRLIASPPGPFDNHAAAGYSDPTNIILNPQDNMYYTMSLFREVDGKFGVCLLRTSNLFDPNQWRAFDGTDFKAKPNQGERCTAVFGGQAPGSLHFSTYLKQFVFLGFGERLEDHAQGFFVRFSNDLIHWSTPVTVLSATNSWGDNSSTEGRIQHIYPSFIDPNGGDNFDNLSQDPYLYYVRRVVPSQTREIVRTRVHFKLNTPEIVSRAQGIYKIKDSAYFSNGQGLYCEISSLDQLNKCGWTYAFKNLPEFPDFGRDQAQTDPQTGARCRCGIDNLPPVQNNPAVVAPPLNPVSPIVNPSVPVPPINNPPVSPTLPAPVSQILPQLCYRVGSTGFLSNGSGVSCPFIACKMLELCGTSNFNALQTRNDHGANQIGSACRGAHIPVGCYRVGPTGFYSNGSQSCPFKGEKMTTYCGKDVSHFYELPEQCDSGSNDVGPECQG